MLFCHYTMLQYFIYFFAHVIFIGMKNPFRGICKEFYNGVVMYLCVYFRYCWWPGVNWGSTVK